MQINDAGLGGILALVWSWCQDTGQTPGGFGERFQARLSLQLHSETLRSCEAGWDEFEVSLCIALTEIDSFLVCSNASHSLRSLREEFKWIQLRLLKAPKATPQRRPYLWIFIHKNPQMNRHPTRSSTAHVKSIYLDVLARYGTPQVARPPGSPVLGL